MPLVPVYSSALSGQSNESISIAIAAPSFAGVSQLGANADHFFDVPVTVSSGRTAPVYNLSYAFEMLRGA
ncbi:hypothetical protein D9M71_760160 [compost metagenome]